MVSLLIAVFLALWIESVVALWYSWGGCIIGGLLIPVSASYGVLKLPPLKAWVHPLAMACAFLTSLVWLIIGTASGNPYLDVVLPGGLFGYTNSNQAGLKVTLGTLIPSLTVSSLILLICAWVARDERERRTDSGTA